jgi:hypothetical protein
MGRRKGLFLSSNHGGIATIVLGQSVLLAGQKNTLEGLFLD